MQLASDYGKKEKRLGKGGKDERNSGLCRRVDLSGGVDGR